MPGDENRSRAKIVELLRARTEKLTRTAAETETVPADALNEIEAFAKLAEFCRDPTPHKNHNRLWLICLVAVIATVILVLASSERPNVLIDLDVKTTSVVFRVDAPTVLLDGARATRLGVAGLSSLMFPSPDGLLTPVQTGDGTAPLAASIEAPPEKSKVKTAGLTLGHVLLPKGAEVQVARHEDDPGQWRITIRQPQDAIALNGTVLGPYLLSSRAGSQGGTLKQGTGFNMAAGSGGDVHLDLTGLVYPRLASRVQVSSISFVQTVEVDGGNQSLVLNRSAIRSGKMILTEVRDSDLELRAGEMLLMDTAAGEINELALDGDLLVLRFRGRVSGLAIHSGVSRDSLMPSTLTWVNDNRRLWLMWTAGASALSTFVLLLRWWKNE